MISTFMSASVNATSNLITSPFLLSSFAILFITPGRTVAICGFVLGHINVAIRLPPNAGRVMSNALVPSVQPIDSSLAISSSVLAILKPVQSATSPVLTRLANLGATSRPIEDAPKSIISGSYSFTTCANAFVYGSVTYSFKYGC